jgi:omega-6 fatty acid desaturase (delta-12 desaturase)
MSLSDITRPGAVESARGISPTVPQTPSVSKSFLQIATSFGGLFAVCAAMYLVLDRSFWLALALAPVAAGFVIRIFIIQHDCGHAAFFRTRRANDLLGMICSLFTLAPYASWRRHHAGHHGVWNDLDRRDSGVDIYSSCLTVDEYRALGRWRRFGYRLVLHPLVANLLLPPLIFLLLYRVPFDAPKTWRRERRAIYTTDLALIGLIGGLGLIVGFGRVTAVQLPVMVIASIAGVWLFSVQHRFENTVWLRHDAWRFESAAVQGSSYLRLPRVLQWFTGNIGFHHVHHLNPRIPNYRLQACHDASPRLWSAPTLTLWSALKQWRFVLWDETQQRMVGFPAKERRPARAE